MQNKKSVFNNYDTNFNIPINAQRLPDAISTQQVTFANEYEQLIIEHQSMHRDSFIPGVIFACQQVTILTELIYWLENTIAF